MRENEYGDLRTLEQDIVWIWKLHGLEVVEERFEKDTWIIKTKRKNTIVAESVMEKEEQENILGDNLNNIK